MKNLLTKLTATAAATITLSVAAQQAQAISFNFNWQGGTGYSARGVFSYNENTAPNIIYESGAGPTTSLQFLSLSVFDPANNLLDSGSSVVNGISNDNFFLFQFNTLTETLSILDTNTAASGNNPYYFISNAVDPSSTPVTPGSTTFNLFAFSNTGSTTFLGSASSIQVSIVPEPSSILSLLALGGLGAGSILKKKQKGDTK
ncbi:hypothetical protein myaer102_49390 [Microcystis viridis NIES-102]|uniref:Ice-binding protein C-terminal domain-containing protein n=1 Tax=Microcystis viridis NIES-102 TaxID=213615 RepID=A0A3G9K7I1_MICVR|nr:PEP-CTERM sorting domain-containing protein [Microcystis viridis]BBH42295.1 hypothetical protein myaer102_49390 [Microcystis viridis NIES-102]